MLDNLNWPWLILKQRTKAAVVLIITNTILVLMTVFMFKILDKLFFQIRNELYTCLVEERLMVQMLTNIQP